MKNLTIAAFLALALALGALPAGAHTYDGDVDSDEGDFERYSGSPGAIPFYHYATTVTDTVDDDHCVYWRTYVDGVENTNAYSCGAYDDAVYNTSMFATIETERCITGHWDCSGYARVRI